MKTQLLTLILSTLILITACGGGSKSAPNIDIQKQKNGALLDSKLVSSSQALPYFVNAYKINYVTTGTDNKKVKVSGLLVIPKKSQNEKSPLLSYQHGTMFLNSHAPSNSALSINAIEKLAGTGFIVSAPDYIGYGESSSIMHPYIHAESLANTSLDMLKASKTFLASKGIKTNEQLFLVGYSEGGYATLSLQKLIQEENTGFTVTASAAGAGPFDLTETAKTLANKTTNTKPAYMSFLLKAYDSIYKLNKIDEMYQSQYRPIINTYFDGKHSGSQINDKLNHTTADLFEAPFLNALRGSGSHVIKETLALNNIYDWKPNVPTRFYHSKKDEIVPYSNAVKALDTMRSNGAQQVSLGDCPFNSHGDCVVPYVLDALNFLSKYADDL